MNKLSRAISQAIVLSFFCVGAVLSQSARPENSVIAPIIDERTTTTAEATLLDDSAIEERLLLIFSEIDELKGVQVNVSNSVVKLDGQANTSGSSTEAQLLASSVEGVVKVENQIEVSRDVSQRVRSTWGRVSQLLQQITVTLPLAILSCLLFIAFWYLAKFSARQHTLWLKLAPNAFIASVIGSIVRLVVLLIGVLLGLYLLDATSIIATVLGAAGIVGLALGFAVRDTVENFISSILLSVRQPFKMNDFVQIDDYQGSVARLTGRDTVLISPDGNQIRIPNSLVFKSVITNYTRHQMRRFNLTVPVDESENLGVAKKVAEQALRAVKGIQTEPAPQVHIEALGETVISLSIFGWVDQRSHDLMKVKSACAVAIKTAFRSAGIVMPESVHTLKIVNSNKKTAPVDTSGIREIDSSRATPAEQKTPAVISAIDDSTVDTSIEPEGTSVITTQLAEEQSGSENLLER